jgi:hypothetical protein
VAAALYVFVVHVLTSEQPFVNPALFRNVNFLLGLALVFVLGIAIYGYVGFFPSMMQTSTSCSAWPWCSPWGSRSTAMSGSSRA